MSETAESVIYKIINNETGELEGAYNRSYYTQYEFSSPGEARSSNVHNIFRNKREYRIQKWKVTYELVDDDCDPYRQEKIPRWSDVQFAQIMKDAIKNKFEGVKLKGMGRPRFITKILNTFNEGEYK